MLQGFINHGADESLIKFLGEQDLIKARAGLVLRQVQVNTKNGSYMANRLVDPNKDNTSNEDIPKESSKTPPRRPKRAADPITRTSKNAHMVELSSVKGDLPEHLKGLVVPGWRNVLVSLDPNADLLVQGRDDQNRVQSRYNTEFTDRNKKEKFNRISKIRQQEAEIDSVIDNIEDPDVRDCLKLIKETALRPGSTRDTGSDEEAIGATTLRGEHVVQEGNKVFLRFIGKKHVAHDHEVKDPSVASMLLDRKKKVGDKGDLFNCDDQMLRVALKPLGMHPKDLRTLKATNMAQQLLSKIPPTTDPKEVQKIRDFVGSEVCEVLGNNKTMALSSYIDPAVFESWSPEGMKAYTEKKNNRGKK